MQVRPVCCAGAGGGVCGERHDIPNVRAVGGRPGRGQRHGWPHIPGPQPDAPGSPQGPRLARAPGPHRTRHPGGAHLGNGASTAAFFILSNLYQYLKYQGACLSVALWHSARLVTSAVLWHGRAGRCCCRATRCTSAAMRTRMWSSAPGCWRRTAPPACWCRPAPSGSALTHPAGWGERDKEAQHCSVMSISVSAPLQHNQDLRSSLFDPWHAKP